ncbi:MAG: hypothetical protein ACPGRC_07005 [Salibacteraceae bacterium]
MKYLFCIGLVFGMMSCDLIKSEDETFTCEKNAPIVVGEKDICARAIGKDHSWSSQANTESLKISIIYGSGSFDLTLNTDQGRIQPGKYLYPGEVSFWVYNLNKTGSGHITVSSIDTVNRVISGSFDIEAEVANNFQASQFLSNGYFNKVSY